jgi:hypothetical protein
MTEGWTYVWPTTLRLPSRPPKVVYLDLLHWIGLAKANSKHREGVRFRDALAACIVAVEAGAAVFPISASTYMEVTKIRQRRQRQDLRYVIERVSGYRAITPRVVIEEHEVEALLDRLLGPSPSPIHARNYLDWGFAHAHGKVGGLKLESEVTGGLKLGRAELELNRWALDGPTAEEELILPRFGYNPMATYEVQLQRAAEEMAQVERFNAYPSWRDPRIRKVVRTREIRIEVEEMLARGLIARGADPETVLAKFGPDLDAFDSMPSFDVSVSLKTAYHRNPEHRWKPNHIQDIDALAETVPYCDIVVTDKEAAAHLVQTGVAERLNTTVLSRTADLIQSL